MIKSNSRASFSTCTRLSRVAVIPVGLHPYYTVDWWSSCTTRAKGMKLTGTVYKTLGLGLSGGQFSNMERREAADIPWASVSTSRGCVCVRERQRATKDSLTYKVAVQSFENRNDTAKRSQACVLGWCRVLFSRYIRINRRFDKHRVTIVDESLHRL